nr:phospholipase D family protein [uncultured Lactobacillus sp.]
MLTIYNLNENQMLERPKFFDLIKKYDTFSGVSFVGSFNIIENLLLPNFQQINLILGLEDRKTGSNLNQYFNVAQKVKELSNASEEFINRLENETLKLRFTKDKLFHSKYFIVENQDEFAIFNGSMNLTNKALNENHEMLWMISGSKKDNTIYKDHMKLFNKNFFEDSTDYINRKIIDQIKGKDKHEITAVVTTDLIESILSLIHI